MFQYPPYEAAYHETFPAFLASLDERFGADKALSSYSRRGEPTSITYHEFACAVRRRADELSACGLDGRMSPSSGKTASIGSSSFLPVSCAARLPYALMWSSRTTSSAA